MGEQSNSETSIRMNADGDFHIIRKNERAHFFSPKEQELILKLYEEEKVILTAKSNTTSASKLREEAWQRIADKINTVSDSGYKRTWQQVKVKHKNIVQTAKRRRAELQRNHRGSATPSQVSAEEEGRLRVEVLPGGACMEPLSGSESSFISVSGHPVLLLPVTKTEAESLSGDETDASDAHVDGVSVALRDGERSGKRTMSSPGPEGHRRWTDADMVSFKEAHSGSFQERTRSSFPFAGRSVEKQSDDIRALYCSYLRKEMENRDQQMAFRALKMKKLEKEILLLDKQLM